MVPIFIICYNNGWMVETMVENILKKFKNNPIYIIDNASTNLNTLNILKKIQESGIQVFFYKDNKGPWRVYSEPNLKNLTSSPFILTDPDLELSSLPEDTINILSFLSTKYNAQKVGLALNIFDNDILQGPYICGKDIKGWEMQFWKEKIKDENYELYKADIDTTFHFYNPQVKNTLQIRLAGDKENNKIFTVKHLPWHSSYIDSIPKQNLLDYFVNGNNTSTTNRLVLSYLNPITNKHPKIIQKPPQHSITPRVIPNYNSKFGIKSGNLIKRTIRF